MACALGGEACVLGGGAYQEAGRVDEQVPILGGNCFQVRPKVYMSFAGHQERVRGQAVGIAGDNEILRHDYAIAAGKQRENGP